MNATANNARTLNRKLASGSPSRRETSCRRSTRGSRCRRSTTTAAAKRAHGHGQGQERAPATSSPIRLRTTARATGCRGRDRTLRRRAGRTDEPTRHHRIGRRRRATSSPRSPSGTLTKKIQRQPSASVMRPPRVGPAVTPSETITAFMPSAWPRWLVGNTSTIRARAGAKISAAPMPWIARATTSSGSDGARPDSADPTVKTARPATQTRSRPTMSASAAERQEAGGDDHEVADDDPFDRAADRCAERPGDRRQGDVHDRGVEGRHEGPDGDEAEDRPLAGCFAGSDPDRRGASDDGRPPSSRVMAFTRAARPSAAAAVTGRHPTDPAR